MFVHVYIHCSRLIIQLSLNEREKETAEAAACDAKGEHGAQKRERTRRETGTRELQKIIYIYARACYDALERVGLASLSLM